MPFLFLFLLLAIAPCQGAIGRPVNIVSIGFDTTLSLEEIITSVEREATKGFTDLIVLPETMCGTGHPEDLSGAAMQAFSELALRYHTYIVCPIDRLYEGRRVNSAILLDREGNIIYPIYDKLFPFWTEYDLAPPVEPGLQPLPAYQTDFGKIGLCICFDLNFPEIWQAFAEAKVELVLWPSAYSGGNLLRSYALQHHYYIVSTTQVPDCTAIDIDGSEILYTRSGNNTNITHLQLDLDRCIFHYDFHSEKLDLLLQEHASEVSVQRRLEREKWFILQAIKPEVSARHLADSYGFEELPDYIRRSRSEINLKRGIAALFVR